MKQLRLWFLFRFVAFACFIVFCINTSFAFSSNVNEADHPELDADNIQASLKENAAAVIRYSQEKVSLDLNKGIIYKRDYAITILNESGEKYGIMYIDYNRKEPIHTLRGYLYDAHGKIIKVVKESEFYDLSETDNYSMYLDYRYKKYTPHYSGYPYTVVYEVETRNKDTYILPLWEPQPYPDVAVESSSFQVTTNQGMEIRIREQLVKPSIQSIDANGIKNYYWNANQLHVIRIEPYSESQIDVTPLVYLAPVHFKIRGKDGYFTNWTEYGSWIYDQFLAKAADLPDVTKSEILTLTASAVEPMDKARLVYQYVQQKMRYVNVAIGIGGYKTESATVVNHQGFGDCKGLSNYTRALLKVCGIDSYYTEVYAGFQPRIRYRDFATLGLSNHIILCIPSKKDTTWLECTDKNYPFGFLGTFTDDRDAIMITPEGGKLVHTTKYKESENLQIRNVIINIDSIGNAKGNMLTSFAGIEYGSRQMLRDLEIKERDEKLKQAYPVDRLEIESYKLEYKKTLIPLCTEKLIFNIPFLGQPEGKSFLVNTTPFNHIKEIQFSRHKRKLPLKLLRGNIDIDSIKYILPVGYAIKDEAGDQEIKSIFGNYSIHFIQGKKEITCIRKLIMHKGIFPAEKFDDFARFTQEIYAMDDLALKIEPN